MTTENTQTQEEQKVIVPEGEAKQTEVKDDGALEIKTAATEPADEPYNETGDAAVDLALKFFHSNGLRKEHPAMAHAAKTGDFALALATLKEKGVNGAEPYVQIMTQEFTRQQAAAASAAAKDKAAVLEAVGGDDRWKAIKAWAGANATEEEAAAINAAFKSGGQQAIMAAKYLSTMYAQVEAQSPAGKSARKPDAARNSTPAAQTPLSPTEYQRELAALTREIGIPKLDRDPRYSALQARRLAYRG